MKRLSFLLFACLFTYVNLSAQSNDEKAVTAAVENLRKAMVDPNKAALEKLTSTDLSYGHSSGKVQNQAEFVDALVSGASDFLNIDLTEQTIRINGNTAIVRHVLSAVTSDNGKPNNAHIAILLVWIKQNKEWKLLARQAVKI